MDKKQVSAAGFAAIKRSPRRLIMSIQGLTKSGKTRLALTAKKPIGYIAIEIGGDEGVVDQFIPEGMDSTEDIQSCLIRMADPANPDNPADVQTAAGEALQQFYDAYYASIANFATTIVDTGSDLWEIARLSAFGRLERVPQLGYTQLNKSMDKLLDDAYGYQGNVIWTHHMKDPGVKSVDPNTGKETWRPGGAYVMAGYGGIKKKVQATVEVWREDLEEMDPDTALFARFHAMIIESRHSAAAMGQKISGDFTFADIGAIIGGTKKDWE